MPALKALQAGLGAAALALALPAAAVYKCQLPGGGVTYQDQPCTGAARGQAVDLVPGNVLGAAAERPVEIRAAIAARRPAIGMTLAELHRALGRPQRASVGQHAGRAQDQLVYEGEARTLHVFMTDGLVTAVQATAGAPRPVTPVVSHRPQRACASYQEVRRLEVEVTKLEYRDKPQVLAELHRQLADARACR